MSEPRDATSHTRDLNAKAAAVLSFDDPPDWERCQRGLVAAHDTGRIELGGFPVWDVADYDFIRTAEGPPDTAHPGLWRQAQLNCVHGLFKVADGVWQARGYDVSNISFLAGDEGWVIIDPLTTEATAAACLDLANRHLGERPVKAVIYTHSHADHYGGVHGVTSPEEVAAGNVRIIAPDGFMREAISENLIAGPAMIRRAFYQFGVMIPKGPRSQIDAGLGKGIPLSPSSLIAPTEDISSTGQELVVDGIRIVFQNTPDAEAPSEMNFHFPDKRLLCMAENCTHTLHNLYPIRGAQVRDALAWSKYIHEALYMFGDDSDISFSSHHWPRFGREDVRTFLQRQRDVYRWLNDQTMRRANRGQTSVEIANELELPDCFSGESDVQGYYGTVSHNIKSVYSRYLGWYDANPAHLNPHPPVETSRKYLDFMGGADAVLSRARKDFDKGDYRWVAQVVDHVVFAEPHNQAARELQAEALEQLGYQSESATWRNAYLAGAHELRNGPPKLPLGVNTRYFEAMTAEQIFDVIGVRFDPDRFPSAPAEINFEFSDLGETHLVGIEAAAIHHRPDYRGESAQTTVTLTRAALAALVSFQQPYDAVIEAGGATISGNAKVFAQFIDALDRPEPMFAIVEP